MKDNRQIALQTYQRAIDRHLPSEDLDLEKLAKTLGIEPRQQRQAGHAYLFVEHRPNRRPALDLRRQRRYKKLLKSGDKKRREELGLKK